MLTEVCYNSVGEKIECHSMILLSFEEAKFSHFHFLNYPIIHILLLKLLLLSKTQAMCAVVSNTAYTIGIQVWPQRFGIVELNGETVAESLAYGDALPSQLSF